jgi:hypothetical protein
MSRAGRFSRCWALGFLCPALLFGVRTSFATLHHVPGDFGTIQAALNASASGDTVLVEQGVYYEAIRFPAANVLLVSNYVFTNDTLDIVNTILDASPFADADTGAVFTFENFNTHDAVVAGFTIRGGTGTRWFDRGKLGGGVFIYQASPTLRSNLFAENAGESVIHSLEGEPVVTHNLFVDNDCVYGSLCLFTDFAAPTSQFAFEWNEIRQNRGEMAVIGVDGLQGTFRFNWFHDFYYPENWAVGIMSSYLDRFEFSGNVFERVQSDETGWEPVVLDETVPLIQDNVFSDCLLGNGWALSLLRNQFYPRVEIRRNVFRDLHQQNTTFAGPGAGLRIQSANALLEDNLFERCLSGSQGALTLMAGEFLSIEMRRNRFLNNRTNSPGGCSGVEVENYASCDSLHPCIVTDNWFEGNEGLAARQYHPWAVWDLTGNYWGDSTAPYHATENPSGRGDTVDPSTHVTPWLTHPPDLSSTREPRPAEAVPEQWRLEPVYPNPFNSTLTIQLRSRATAIIKLTVYDIAGRLVRDLWRGVIPTEGRVNVSWNGDSERGPASSGIYFITAERQDKRGAIQTQKAILLR